MSDDDLIRRGDVLRVLRSCDDFDIVDDICVLPADPVAAAAGELAEAFHPMKGHTSIYIHDVNGRQRCLICQQSRVDGECEHLDDCEYAAYRAALPSPEPAPSGEDVKVCGMCEGAGSVDLIVDGYVESSEACPGCMFATQVPATEARPREVFTCQGGCGQRLFIDKLCEEGGFCRLCCLRRHGPHADHWTLVDRKASLPSPEPCHGGKPTGLVHRAMHEQVVAERDEAREIARLERGRAETHRDQSAYRHARVARLEAALRPFAEAWATAQKNYAGYSGQAFRRWVQGNIDAIPGEAWDEAANALAGEDDDE